MAKNKVVFEQFDDLTAFSRAISRPANRVFDGQTQSSIKNTDGAWAGTKTYDEAVRLFNEGWAEKADEIRKHFVQFERAQEREVSYQKSRPVASVVGFTPHVPNAIMGLPNSMIYTERTPMKAKVVRIIYNMCMNADTSASDIMNAGLSVMKIAYSLERKGFRVRIDVNPMFTQDGREIACALVCVKDWRQPIDIKKVAFPVAHTSMFRRLGFRWLETTPDLTENGFRYGYGRSVGDAKEAEEILRDCKAIDDNDYYVNVEIARRWGYDPEQVAKAIGIKNL